MLPPPFFKSRFLFGLSLRGQEAAKTCFAGATNFHSCRFVSSREPVPPKKKESLIKFSPNVPADKFLERRKTKFYEKFASKEGKTSPPPPKTSSTLKWFYVVLFGGFVGFICKIFPHGLGRNLFQQFLQHHQPDGSKTKVSDSLVSLIRDVMADIELSPENVSATKAFINSSDEQTSTFGGYKMSKGLLIGLPSFMNYRSAEDINVDRLNLASSVSNSEDVTLQKTFNDYATSIVLSDDAKKFLIARELYRGIHNRQLYEALFPALILGVAAPVLFGVKKGVANKKIIVKGFAAIFSLSPLLLVHMWIGDFWHRQTEKVLDASAAQLGVNYARGGVEFYDKTLRRHIALRDLLPQGRGKKLYNLKGEKFPLILREKSVPITKRRDHCKTFLIDSD